MRKKSLRRIITTALATTIAIGLTASPSYADPPVDVAKYDPPTYTCLNNGDQPGVIAFREMIQDRIDKRSYIGGIYRCDSQGINYEHANGRAFDWMRNAYNPSEEAQVEQVLAWLLATDANGEQAVMARRLGIQYMQWKGRIFRVYRPNDGWTASSDHFDHIHIAFNLAGARQETTWYTTDPKPAHWYPDGTPAPAQSAVAVVDNYGEFHVAGVRADGITVNTYYNTVTGWHVNSLATNITGTPSTATYNGEYHIVGSDGSTVYHKWLSNGTWHGWVPVSPGADPVAIVYNNEFHVVSRQSDGTVSDTFYNPATGWHSQNHGGSVTGNLSVVVYNGEFHIVGSGGGTVSQRWYNGSGTWYG